MIDLAPPRVMLSMDKTVAVLVRGEWRSKVRASTLPDWLQFYREQAAKRPATYAAWLTPIERAIEKAGLQIPPIKQAPSQGGKRR